MKVMIAHAYLNGYGGGERFVLEQANHMSKRHEVRILTWEYIPEMTFAGFRNHEIVELKSGSSSLNKMIAWSMRKENFDVCSTHAFPSNFLSFRNRGTVWYCHRPDLPFQDSRNPYHLALKAFDRLSIRRVKKVITNSRFSAEMIKRYYKRDAEVINPGIDPGEFRPGRFGDYVLLVSRISPEKNVELAIDTMELVQNMKLVIVAGWVNRKYYRKLKIDRERVRVVENIPDTELKKLYANCLCVLQTATNESFGIVPLEAMASGKPVVAPGRGGFKETITEKTGFLLEPEPEILAEKIRYLYENKGIARRIGRAGLKRAGLFSWGKQMKLMDRALGL